MKKVIVLLIVLIAINVANAQGCLSEGIAFTTQVQIDNFQTNYPGCTVIEGDVTIHGQYITNLNGLDVLTSFGGDLLIVGNNSLTNLTGLDNLTSIGGYLRIGVYNQGNPSLTSLTGLNNLTSVGVGIEIMGNDVLTNLIGLDNLSYIGSGLTIWGNSSLTSLYGLVNVTSIGGYLSISSNPALTSLTMLENLTSIGDYLWINGNDVLTSLTGLDGLTSIGGDLLMCDNSALTSLTGLDNLTSIGDGLWINGNDGLTSLMGLDNLTFIGGDLNILNNISLSNGDAQWLSDYLVTPTGAVNIYNNATGCNSVIEVAAACGGVPCLPYGNYNFVSQADIDNLQTGFPNCTALQGNVTINGSDITNLSGLDNLTSVEGGYLAISSNAALTSLTGLDNLISIGGNLMIEYNAALASVTGLEGLISIGDDLWINGNAALNCLTGLEHLTTIGDNIEVEFNEELTNLTGIENVNTGSIGNLTIRCNSSLSSCAVKSICDYLVTPSGTIEIENNAPGCNSQEEVLEACSQSCLPEGITFTTQGQVDNFQVNYPGCTEIEGNVSVGNYMGTDITNLSALNVLTSIGGSLGIVNNDFIVSLTGLENLTAIGGAFWIQGNDNLIGVTGLESLTSIAGDLWILDNLSLTSLTGLENIDAGSIVNLGVKNNPSLSSCDTQTICESLSAPNGFIEIYWNAPGCNSQAEVVASCLTSSNEYTYNNGLTISPNPSKEIITISSPDLTGTTYLSISTVSGEKVLERQLSVTETQIDISALPRGVYFVRVWDEKITEVKKLVKQ